ncbi:MAG: DUF2326 domain-containing protein [Saprospiraceae bacterium]
MFLEKLIINSNIGQIREIPFKEGLNLVLDKSSLDEKVEGKTVSGNSVGKTTLLRAIDFCFGSDGKDFYVDREFHIENTEVLNFLTNKDISFILRLKFNKRTLLLERSFNKGTLNVNGIECDNLKDYKSKIAQKIFGITGEKPTLRSLMPKFIRKDSGLMSNTLKFLHSTTTIEDYESVYLTLFGFNDFALLEKRLSKQKIIRKLKRKLRAVKDRSSITAIKQRLALIEKDISTIDAKIKGFKISKSYENLITQINDLKSSITNATKKVSNIGMKISLNEDTLEELNKSQAEINPLAIKEIYEQAEVYIPNLQKEFEDVLDFHSQMIANKITFVEGRIKQFKEERTGKERILNQLLTKEEELIKILADTGTLSDLEKLFVEKNKLVEKKGRESQVLKWIEDIENDIKNTEKDLKEVNQTFSTYKDILFNNVLSFNEFFKKYSKKLYNEEYFLSYDWQEGKKIDFTFNNIEGNVGGGKKKGQVTAFDLAYISFINKMKSSFPHFVLHDSIEDVHYNQIDTFFKIANEINGQYIVSILKDKLNFLDEPFIEQNTILELSESAKFFRF